MSSAAAGNKIRIYDLAREVKQDVKRILEDARREGIDVSVPSNTVPKEVADKIRNKYFPKKEVSAARSVKLIRNKSYIDNVRDKISIAKTNNPTKLDLSDERLTDENLNQILPEILQMNDLQALKLANNNLTSFDKQLITLRNLKIIHLNSNQIKALPPEIGNLKNLIELRLGNNKLSDLPAEISQLTNLEHLQLESNHFNEFPKEIVKLTNLRVLQISQNQLSELPQGIKNLVNLYKFDISQNHLGELPIEIGQLSNLLHLDVTNNQLRELPKEIGQLKYLKTLFLDGNQLYEIKSLTSLTNLKQLDLRGNPVPIPEEILDDFDNPPKIIQYYLDFLKGTKPLKEGKIILVGQGRVGKTSLREALKSETCKCDDVPNKTEGLEVVEWNLNIEGKGEIKLNIWDFGGQEVYHATHQFFFKTGLYILVVDLDERVEWRTNRLEYWLKKIQTLTEKSRVKEDFKTPVIIIGNKMDANNTSADLFDLESLKEKYTKLDITKFIRVACQKGTNIPEVISEVKNQFERIGVYDEFPTPYFEVKRKIQHLNRNTITTTEFAEIAEDDIEQKLYVLESIGSITTFTHSKKKELKDLIVIKPKWITEGIYKILSAGYLLDEKRGKVEIGQVRAILDDEEYPQKDAIIEMMKEYDICFAQIENKRELLMFPSYFTVIKPPIEKFTDGVICFKYLFKILLDNVFPQFIVNLDKTIFQNNLYWRTGVQIIKNEKRAVVEVDLEENTISIYVEAQTRKERKELLEDLRAKLEEIIGNQEIKEEISVPNYPNEFVDYETLINLRNEGQLDFPIEGLGQFDIDYLLHEIDINSYEIQENEENELNPPTNLEVLTNEEIKKLNEGTRIDEFSSILTRLIEIGIGIAIICIAYSKTDEIKEKWGDWEPASFIYTVPYLLGGTIIFFAIVRKQLSLEWIDDKLVEGIGWILFRIKGRKLQEYKEIQQKFEMIEKSNKLVNG